MNFAAIREALKSVDAAIAAACREAGRARSEVMLVAVSKRQPLEKLKAYEAAASEMGIPVVFGESYVQELSKKKTALDAQSHCHLVGPLQSNKVRAAVKAADLIESVHSAEIAALISDEAQRLGKKMPVLLQVNISKDPAKRGFLADQLRDFLHAEGAKLTGLEILGLMTITELYAEPSAALPDFRALKTVSANLAADGLLPTNYDLSMGMSADYPFAIAAGATIVRVGTALFGVR